MPEPAPIRRRSPSISAPAAPPRTNGQISAIRELKAAWLEASKRAEEPRIGPTGGMFAASTARTRAKPWNWLPGHERQEVDCKATPLYGAGRTSSTTLAFYERFMSMLSPAERAIVEGCERSREELAAELGLTDRQVRRAIERVNAKIRESVMTLPSIAEPPAPGPRRVHTPDDRPSRTVQPSPRSGGTVSGVPIEDIDPRAVRW